MAPVMGSPWAHSEIAPVDSSARDTLTGQIWDVVIVGGGLAGVSAAAALLESGRSVCLVEAHQLGRGTTGSATAKVTSSHGVIASRIAERHGFDIAVRYQEANDRGFRWLEDLVATLPDDVGWSEVTHVVHGIDRADALDASFHIALAAASAPIEVQPPAWARGPSLAWGRSALVQPLSLVRAIARRLQGEGVAIRQGAPVVAVRDRGGVQELRLGDDSTLRGAQVVVATGLPVVDPELLVPRMAFQWHLAAAIPSDAHVPTTYDVDALGLSTRPAVLQDGRPVAVVVGPATDLREVASGRAIEVMRELCAPLFDLSSATHMWTARDGASPGLLPVAHRSRRHPYVTTITGMNGWGFTNAAAIARELPRMLDIVERSGEGSGPLDDLWEKGLSTSPTSLIGPTIHTAAALARGVMSSIGRGGSELPIGAGVIMGGPLNPRAVCRTEDGTLHSVSARCTHAGCLVEWNTVSSSWICPCHGSEFGPDGTAIQGPATRPLRSVASGHGA